MEITLDLRSSFENIEPMPVTFAINRAFEVNLPIKQPYMLALTVYVTITSGFALFNTLNIRKKIMASANGLVPVRVILTGKWLAPVFLISAEVFLFPIRLQC